MFHLSSEPLTKAPELDSPISGGFVWFEGRVRNHDGGRKVVSLEYEAAPELAEAEGNRLLEEAKARFGADEVVCFHRVGHLKVGETAVWIGVASGHRREAFEACEWILDELKRRVPIWKKEHYEDGDSGWVGADLRADTVPLTEESLYQRQIRLSEVGPEGQEKLGLTRVLVVGVGGLASGVLPALAGAGIGRITIADGDRVEASNLHRQTLFDTRDVGKNKAKTAAIKIGRQNPFVSVGAISERITVANLDLREFDAVVDATDNFHTKFLLNESCVKAGLPLFSAGLHVFEGSLTSVVPGGPCLRCLWPEQPVDGCVSTCAETGILAPVPHVFGALLAAEVLKWVLGLPIASHQLLLFDLRTLQATVLPRERNSGCPICGGGLDARPVTLDASQLGEISPFMLVDLAEDTMDRLAKSLGESDHLCIPLSQFDAVAKRLPREQNLLLVCPRGIRSGSLAAHLRSEGWSNVYSLAGGTKAL